MMTVHTRFVLCVFVLLLLVALLVPPMAMAVDNEGAPQARTVFFRPHLSIYHNRYSLSGAYIGKALGGGTCTPIGAGWCRAKNAYGKVFLVKWCNYPRCVRW